jgi:hypothetical protein
VFEDVVNGIADGLEVLDILVWDRHVEALLSCYNDLDHRQSVDIQVIGEGLVKLYVLNWDTGDLVDDLGESVDNLFLRSCHGPDLLSCDHLFCKFGVRQNVGGSREDDASE